jgi:2-C-methyl-D-erythritol 2,4-cyclodiphosphate synthase
VSGFRVGTGFDAHRLVAGRKLMLGGVEVAHPRGLEGHSDGDCLVHALCDAMLGAAGERDMGTHFPSADPRWKDASGASFLERTVRIVDARGFTVENVDVTVIAQEPVLAPHIERMRSALARGLALETERVSVKAKSTDGLGAVGRGEGIAAIATVLLSKRE